MDKEVNLMEKEFFKTLQALICKESPVLIVSVSAGIDSMTLLNLAIKFKAKAASHDFSQLFCPDIRVCHCRHGLRDSESQADFEFVRQTALNAGLEFFDLDCVIEPGPSVQTRAREKRFASFAALHQRVCKKENIPFDHVYILLGHNQDDQCETVLFRLFRGTGPGGLTGITQKRDIFIRPLLNISRKAIKEYALKEKIDWRDDSSNNSVKYSRNKLRHIIIPKIEKTVGNEIKAHICNISNELMSWKIIVESLFRKLLKDVLILSDKHNSMVIGLQPFGSYIRENYNNYIDAKGFLISFFSWIISSTGLIPQKNKLKDMARFILRSIGFSTESDCPAVGAYLLIGESPEKGEYILRLQHHSFYFGPSGDHPYTSCGIDTKYINGIDLFENTRFESVSIDGLSDVKINFNVGYLEITKYENTLDFEKNLKSESCCSFFSMPADIEKNHKELKLRTWMPGDVCQSYKIQDGIYFPAGTKKLKKRFNKTGLDPVVKAFLPLLVIKGIVYWFPGCFTGPDKQSFSVLKIRFNFDQTFYYLIKWTPERLFYEI